VWAELAALNVGDVLHRGKIRRDFRLGTEDAKYCKARTIYLEAPKAVSALLAYLRTRKPALSYSGSEPLFVGKRRNEREGTFRLLANSLADLLRQVYQRAGIVGASSHSGRRWFMTELARAGVHPRIIQQRARHSSLATTQRYIAVTPDQERQAVRAIRR
jgi:integrase/recombinase XerD